MEAFGQMVRRLRGPRSLRDVASEAHMDAGHLSRIERSVRGGQLPSPEIVDALDRALGAEGALVAFREQGARLWRLDAGLWRPADSERLAEALVAEKPTAENAVTLAHQWLIAEPPQVYQMRAGRRVGRGTVATVEQRVQQLRLLDDHVGGTDTHALVTAERDATADLLKAGSYTEAVGRRLLVAIGELCQLAGWTLSDAGQHKRAEQVYLLGVRAAHAGGDVAGAANNLSSLAYQVANVGDRREAETLARSAYAGAKDAATATTRALLAERVAWAAARRGDASAAERALGTVETAFADRKPDDDPIWTYWLNDDEIQVMAGRVWTQLRRPLRAVPILEHATAGYGEDTGRETALYLTWLAESLLQANEVERAAGAAARALQLSRAAGSARAEDRVTELRRLLARHRGNAAADAFLDEASG
ncbi:helix-turn-helix transcriptional regulator [Actinoplanes sp. NPDC049118]|uniref:helix-turn-helix domain-containing protein n=1 Tax=Actinoplanes sp. NPDC049118 TaxID=3155769 RepID=UPI0033D1D017